jgi:hypothetical protein
MLIESNAANLIKRKAGILSRPFFNHYVIYTLRLVYIIPVIDARA